MKQNKVKKILRKIPIYNGCYTWGDFAVVTFGIILMLPTTFVAMYYLKLVFLG